MYFIHRSQSPEPRKLKLTYSQRGDSVFQLRNLSSWSSSSNGVKNHSNTSLRYTMYHMPTTYGRCICSGVHVNPIHAWVLAPSIYFRFWRSIRLRISVVNGSSSWYYCFKALLPLTGFSPCWAVICIWSTKIRWNGLFGTSQIHLDWKPELILIVKCLKLLTSQA